MQFRPIRQIRLAVFVMTLRTAKVRNVTQILTDTGHPVSCWLQGCRVLTPVHQIDTKDRPNSKPTFHMTLRLPKEPPSCLLTVHDMTKVQQGAFHASSKTLTIKVPHGGRRFLCQTFDEHAIEMSPYDLSVGSTVDVLVRFGGVWPDMKGYTWSAVQLRRRA